MIKKIVKNRTFAGLLALTGSVLLTSGISAIAQNSYVTDFGTGGLGSDGWKSDDTRNAAGTNLVGGTSFADPGFSHAPSTSASNIYSSTDVAAQIDWQNLYGSRGNLGFLDLTANVTGSTAFTAAQKSTISVINSAAGLGDTAAALGEDFSATYRFTKGQFNNASMSGGVALKIGIQSTAWAQSQSPSFTAVRSGEPVWDLILVHDPSFDGVSYATPNLYTETVTYNQGVWKLFGQVGNGEWVEIAGEAPPGGSAAAKTLEQWAADSVWSEFLFGDGAKISDVQFGVGSGNTGIDAGLDWAQISFLNNGDTIDFVDASTWTGTAGDNEFGTANNWTFNGLLQGPSANNNVVFTGSGTTTANVSSNTDARSIAVGAGTVNLAIANGTTLALKNDGFLSAEKNATLNLTGGTNSLVTAAAVEAWGNVNIATKVTLDGGSVNQPVRNGRYAIVVAEGGELTLENGADVTVGNASGAQGVKTLIRVGEMTAEGGVGTMNIENGAHLTAGSTVGTGNWTGFHVGDWGGEGVVNQTGGLVDLYGALVIGNEAAGTTSDLGSKGTYNLSAGTLNVYRPAADNGAVIIGRATADRYAEGILNVSGGLLDIGAVGGASGNVAMVLGGLSDNVAAYANAKGTVNQTGGIVRFTNGKLIFGRGQGTYNLNGGTLEIGGTNGISATIGGTPIFNFGGGTLKAINSNLTTSINANVVGENKASYIDTNGKDVTWNGDLTADGLHQFEAGGTVLRKIGVGKLTFTTGTRKLDTFAVLQDKAGQTGGSTSAVEFMVGSGDGSTGSYLMDGGTLQINPSTKKADGTAVSGSLRVGDFNGTGTFTQTAGDVIITPNSALIVGNRGGKGTYEISGGTLQLSNALNVLGRNDPKDGTTNPSWAENLGPSEGTLAISGDALVEVLTGGSLVLSSNSNTTIPGIGRASKGTINQTGGTLRINNNASLFLGAAGDGEYNLDGGVLEIGGNSLKGVYNNIGGTYAFNLGGGTIKAIGSKLITDVDANLVAGTTSTIDTNNLGVDWSGDLTADGLHQIDHGGSKLIKDGLGTLAFTGTGLRKLDTFAVEGGGVRQTAGTTSAVELMVGTDPGNEGTYLMEAGDLNITAATDGSGNPVAGSFRVGDWGGEGTFTQTGGNVTLGSNSALNIGNRGGQGTYDISGGKLTLTSINVMGRNTTSDLIASEGVLNISGDALVDMLTGSSWILSSNTPTNAPNGAVATASKGTINQTGGTFRFNSGSNLYLGAYGTGAYNLTGGTLEIGGTSLNGIYNNTGGSYSFKFGGGTLKVIGSDLNTSIDASISNNNQPAGATSYIDTNGFNATWAGNLAAAGLRQVDHGGSKLVKMGDGNLKFTGLSRVLDTFAVEGGSAQQTAGETSAVEFMVGTGAGNTGSYLMDAGTLRIKPSVDALGGAVSGTFRVGDFGGTGTFTQTGGAVILESNSALNIGNRGGNGTYEISGGSLTLSDSVNVIGRNKGNDTVASAGVLKIDGAGVVEVQSGGSVILSSNETTTDANIAQASTGRIDQTGGTFRVNDDAYLYLGGVGAGTYNLSGGVLEIGGDSLQGVYNVGGSYAFNLDGGTVKVIDSDLNTNVDATLKAGKTTTIDTNGFSAVFTGTISSVNASAAGHLTKVGAGELVVANDTTIGTLVVSAGSAAFLSNLAAGDIDLAGGDLDLKGDSNTATGNVTVRDGSTLMGAIAADGDMVIEAGGTHQLCNESISNLSGSYLLKTDATLIIDLDGVDPEIARLTLPTITLESDSWIVLHSTAPLDLFDTIFLFDSGLLTAGSVNIQGTGGIAGYGFELDNDGYVKITAVPEPSAMVLLAIGLGFTVIFLMKRKRHA